jgi:hypothetical protein
VFCPREPRESQRRHAQTPDERWKSAYTPIEFQFLEKLIAVPRATQDRAGSRRRMFTGSFSAAILATPFTGFGRSATDNPRAPTNRRFPTPEPPSVHGRFLAGFHSTSQLGRTCCTITASYFQK